MFLHASAPPTGACLLGACSAPPTQCLLSTFYLVLAQPFTGACSACSAPPTSACSALFTGACSDPKKSRPPPQHQRQTLVVLRQNVPPYTYGGLTGKKLWVWGGTKHNQAKSCKIMSCQNQVNVMSCEKPSVSKHTDNTNSIFQRKTVRNKLPSHTCTDPENVRPSKKNWARKKNGKLGETTTADHGGRARRRPGLHGGGWCRRAKPAARPGGLRAALARGRAADPGGPALLLPPGPAAAQQGLLQPAPRPRGAQRLPSSARSWARASSATSTTSTWSTTWRRSSVAGGAAGGTRARATSAGTGWSRWRSGSGNGPILQLLDKTYFLDPEGHWVVSRQAALRALAAGRAAAERGGGVRGLRRHAAPRLEAPWHLARVLRVAQRADARAELAGRPCGQLDPALKEHRTVRFLAFDGH